MLYDKRWDQQLKPIELPPERQALLAAAEYIEAHGWCQKFWSRRGEVCAVTALNETDSYGHTSVGKAARRLFFDINGTTLMEYNDAVGRTKQEVISALRATALGGR